MPAVQRLRQTADWLPRRITADGWRVNSEVLPANLDAADVYGDVVGAGYIVGHPNTHHFTPRIIGPKNTASKKIAQAHIWILSHVLSGLEGYWPP